MATNASSPQQTSWISNSLWGFMLLQCVVVAVYGSTYFFHTPGDAHFSHYIQLLRLHIAGGIGAVLAGPWQFSQRLRTRNLNLHRWMGRFYLLEVALGSIGGFGMAVVSEEGLPTNRDPQLRVDPGCRHSSPVHAADVVRVRLAFPAQLHCGLLAVLGSECARCRVDGPQTRVKLPSEQFSFFLFLFSIF